LGFPFQCTGRHPSEPRMIGFVEFRILRVEFPSHGITPASHVV
jgi:hypothetical protein